MLYPKSIIKVVDLHYNFSVFFTTMGFLTTDTDILPDIMRTCNIQITKCQIRCKQYLQEKKNTFYTTCMQIESN